jgi:hypothetical protein
VGSASVSSLAFEPVKAALSNPDIRTIRISVTADNGKRTIVPKHSDLRDSLINPVTCGHRRSYHLALGEVRRDTPKVLASKKRRISMARVRSERLFSDDSWGLFLVPILTCVALLVSALVWL